MEENASSPRQSHIPRPSKLPVRAGGIRPSPSIDALRNQGTNGLRIPRLRAAPSRDRIVAARTSSVSRERNISTETIIHTPVRESSKSYPTGTPANGAANKDVTTQSPSQLGGEGWLASRQSSDIDIQSERTTPMPIRSRKPRPSLSERTIETLAHLPASPAIKKRNSSFYNSNSPMRPPSRSNDSRPGTSGTDTTMGPPRSTSSRPPSSSGIRSDAVPLNLRSSTSTLNSLATPETSQTPSRAQKTPLRLKSYQNLTKTPTSKSSLTNLSAHSVSEISPSPAKRTPALKSGSKTVSGRTPKPRASMGGLFRKSSVQELDGTGENKKLSPTFSDTSEFSPTSNMSKASSVSSVGVVDTTVTPRKSSAALRDQIAKAKAAKRAQAALQASGSLSPSCHEGAILAAGSFDFGLAQDPFNQLPAVDEHQSLLKRRINAARTDGRLNIAGMELKEIPSEVMNMYNLESINSGSWAESVDLTRFVAADNEIEHLGDEIFPDVDSQAIMDDEDSKGNQFGGLETLDLHGNLLSGVPLGLRRLELLTTLNLSNNKLSNDCFEVVSQIRCLRDLKLAGNNLTGQLPASLSKLDNLESIDVQNNALGNLPDCLSDLVRLRVLNVSGNEFTSLPFAALQHLPLTYLSAAKNKLHGTLMDLDHVKMPQLQELDVTANHLTALAAGEVDLPALHQLSCSANRIATLPNITTWLSLLTLVANDNKISSVPDGFVSLRKVKNVDLSGNDLVVLDDRIALMESLEVFRISGNPLREKKFAGMTTEDLKRVLKGRIAPEEPEPLSETEHVQEASLDSDGSFATAMSDSPLSPMSAQFEWPVKAGGVLDRSYTKSYSLNPVAMSKIASNNAVRSFELHHNFFKEIPTSIAFFAATLTSLSLAHNELTSDSFINDDIELPALKELNLSSNTFNTLRPLVQRLQAPALQKIDVSFNRLTTLPPLKPHFPGLAVVLASNNTIRELSPEAVKGLRVMDCSSNELNSLNSRLGLLGGVGGLERLDVSGNRFRVPKYTILEKGTEAVLAWLRDRIPVGELESCEAREEQGL